MRSFPPLHFVFLLPYDGSAFHMSHGIDSSSQLEPCRPPIGPHFPQPFTFSFAFFYEAISAAPLGSLSALPDNLPGHFSILFPKNHSPPLCWRSLSFPQVFFSERINDDKRLYFSPLPADPHPPLSLSSPCWLRKSFPYGPKFPRFPMPSYFPTPFAPGIIESSTLKI